MSENEDLRQALGTFAGRINADPKLRKMVSDWERTIALEATDGEGAGIVVHQGEILVADLPAEPDIRLSGSRSVLHAVFSGRLSPTEPYVDGSLRVEGSQEDVLRLDFLSLMIWGE
jgi:putative sterol carrier protein